MSADEENEIFPSESDMDILQQSRNSSEELKQESTRNKAMMNSRDILVERRFKE